MVVGRVTFEVQGDEKWVCDGLDCFRSLTGGLRCAKDLRRPRCGCSGGPTSRNGGLLASQSADDMAPIPWPASVTQNEPCLGGPTPQIEFRF